MDVHQLELGNSTYDDGMDVPMIVYPGYQGAHEIRHLAGRWRRVDRLPGGRIHYVVLHSPVLPRRSRPTSNAVYQVPVDPADEPLHDRCPFIQMSAHELERTAIVQQLACVVRIGTGNR